MYYIIIQHYYERFMTTFLILMFFVSLGAMAFIVRKLDQD